MRRTVKAPTGRLAQLRRGSWREDEGIALVVVVGFVAVIAGLVALTAATGIASLRSSSDHVEFESALTTAEAGVDHVLSDISAVNAANPTSTAAYTTAAPCNVTAPTAADLATEDAERIWARNTLEALATAQPGCVKSASKGDFIAVRPPGRQSVYSLGWYPRREAGAARRLLKAEYLFAPFKPNEALLTDGALDFTGSVAISAVGAATASNVHTNGSVLGYNNSLQVEGALSASGGLPGACPNAVLQGCQAGADEKDLPTISARSVYPEWNTDPNAWWDLCPDGTVKTPSGIVPCQGTTVGSSGFNGWVYTAASGTTPPIWTLPRTAGGPYPGTYYVFQGDAKIGDTGNSSATWPITVIAEAATGVVNTTTCGKSGGNIEWKLFNLTPRLPGLQLLADANLTGDANASAGTGVFLAGDKVSLSTSSAVINGAVVASNTCAAQGANLVQGVTINFSDDVETPVKDVIRTTLWLEYSVGD